MKTSRKHIVWPSETEEQLGIGQVDSVTGEKKKPEDLVLHCRR